MLGKIANKFLDFVKPFVIWWGHLHWPFAHKKITGDHYYLWRDYIEPGYVLLSTTYGELSNLINPVDIKHGAMYAGGVKIKYVVEALGKGADQNNLVKHMTTKDVFIIIKPKFATKEQRQQAALNAVSYIGTPYDYLFDMSDKALYCFEVPIKAYLDVFPDKQFKYKEMVKGKRIYDSDTFLKDPDNWEVVIDSRRFDEIKD